MRQILDLPWLLFCSCKDIGLHCSSCTHANTSGKAMSCFIKSIKYGSLTRLPYFFFLTVPSGWVKHIRMHSGILHKAIKWINLDISSIIPQDIQKSNKSLSQYFHQQLTLFSTVWKHYTSYEVRSGGPTLSCFGPVYQPQCVPPTSISSSSPLRTTSGTLTSPNASPTHMPFVIWAMYCNTFK